MYVLFSKSRHHHTCTNCCVTHLASTPHMQYTLEDCHAYICFISWMLLRFERPKDDTRESISGPKYPYLPICPFINMDSESTPQSAMLSRPKILMLHGEISLISIQFWTSVLSCSPLPTGHAQSGHTLQCKTEYLKPRVTDTILNALQQDPSSGSADVVEFHYPSGRWPAKRDQLPGESNHLWAWGQADNPDDYACGLERSVNDTFRYIERNGPFLGIIGFSMGAAMGAIIASLLEKRHSIGNFKFDVSRGNYRWHEYSRVVPG